LLRQPAGSHVLTLGQVWYGNVRGNKAQRVDELSSTPTRHFYGVDFDDNTPSLPMRQPCLEARCPPAGVCQRRKHQGHIDAVSRRSWGKFKILRRVVEAYCRQSRRYSKHKQPPHAPCFPMRSEGGGRHHTR